MKLPTRHQVSYFLSNLVEKSLVLLVVIYIAFSVGRSVLKNYQANQRIKGLEDQLTAAEQEKAYLTNLIAYYKTQTFKELKAREELGWQKPGEHVLSVPVENEETAETGKPLGPIVNQPAPEIPLPNYEKWFNYFFKS